MSFCGLSRAGWRVGKCWSIAMADLDAREPWELPNGLVGIAPPRKQSQGSAWPGHLQWRPKSNS